MRTSSSRLSFHSLLAALVIGLLPACSVDAATSEGAMLGTASEALSISTSTSSAYLVSKLYTDLLGRAPSSAEQNLLVGKPRTTVADVVLDSTEYRSLRLRAMFQTYLGRVPTSVELTP